MITNNKALREGLILRGLVITSYVCYELIARWAYFIKKLSDAN